MPYTPYALDIGPQPANKMLQQFLNQTQSFLKKLITMPAEFGLRFIIDIQDKIDAAFEAETVNSFETAEGDLVKLRSNKLADVGLTDLSLSAKFSALNQLSQLVWSGARKAIKYLLSLVNSILGSLGKLTLAADAIQEMKDLIENTTDFVEDDG